MSTWQNETPPGVTWSVGTRRITEDGALRVTERSNIRIIDYIPPSPWSAAAPDGGDIWTKE